MQIIVCNNGVKQLHNQLMNLTIERDEAAQELDRVTRHRDAALELAEERRQGWIMANQNAFHREQELQERLEELQVEHHQLNNRLFSIPHPYQGILMWVVLK